MSVVGEKGLSKSRYIDLLDAESKLEEVKKFFKKYETLHIAARDLRGLPVIQHGVLLELKKILEVEE